MKFEKLNSEKFEKIEKRGLGKILGGAAPVIVCGYEQSGETHETSTDALGNVHYLYSYSNDWSKTTMDENNKPITHTLTKDGGGDMSADALRKHLDCYSNPGPNLPGTSNPGMNFPGGGGVAVLP